MQIRVATPDDAEAIAAIYAPIVLATVISFEIEPPSTGEMSSRIASTVAHFPWLVSLDAGDRISGYAYASKHRERPAYQWSVDTTAYVREDSRGQGIGKRLYLALFEELARHGYFRAFAGIALPNDASVALHESVGFTPVGVYGKVGYKMGAWHDVGWWQRALRPLATPEAPLPFAGGSRG